MVEHLATLIEHFPGAANQTRCFTHILNLVAKSILHQFDVKKKTMDDSDEPMEFNDAVAALVALALELEDDMQAVADEYLSPEENEEDDENHEIGDDDDDGLGDERKGMSNEEVVDLDESVVPIWLMLTKVR